MCRGGQNLRTNSIFKPRPLLVIITNTNQINIKLGYWFALDISCPYWNINYWYPPQKTFSPKLFIVSIFGSKLFITIDAQFFVFYFFHFGGTYFVIDRKLRLEYSLLFELGSSAFIKDVLFLISLRYCITPITLRTQLQSRFFSVSSLYVIFF